MSRKGTVTTPLLVDMCQLGLNSEHPHVKDSHINRILSWLGPCLELKNKVVMVIPLVVTDSIKYWYENNPQQYSRPSARILSCSFMDCEVNGHVMCSCITLMSRQHPDYTLYYLYEENINKIRIMELQLMSLFYLAVHQHVPVGRHAHRTPGRLRVFYWTYRADLHLLVLLLWQWLQWLRDSQTKGGPLASSLEVTTWYPRYHGEYGLHADHNSAT